MKNYNTVKQYFETKLINHPTTDCKLSLNLGNVAITETYEDESYIGFTGRSAGAECHCKRCGQVITNLKQYKTTYTILAKINSKNVVLKLRKKMYHCPDCDSSTVEQLLDVSGKNQKSNSFIRSMLRCLKETMTYSTLARLYKVSVSNVIFHFDKAVFKETQIDRSKVRNISVDEVRLTKQKFSNYQFVIMDSDTKQVLDILESRCANVIQNHLEQHYKGISTFTQDLWKTYKNVALKVISNVKIIADPFHVVRLFMWAFSRTRVALAKKKGLKTNKNWKLLTKAKTKLDKCGHDKLDALLDPDPELKAAHDAKEMALEMFRCKDKALYLKLLPTFKELIDQHNLVEFQTAYNSLLNWHEEIMNMFDYDYSNGAMERGNRTIKLTMNISFGVRNLSRVTKLIQYRVN